MDESEIIGECPAMIRVRQQIQELAMSSGPILIFGGPGTGKELTARTIHAANRQRSGPFIHANCAAIVDELLESELYGRAAIIGPDSSATGKGQIEAAASGTLFLDNADSISPALQGKLLKTFQDRRLTLRPTGESIEINPRIIASSLIDPDQAETSFQKDFYQYLNTHSIKLPPLRERSSDHLLFLQFFLKQWSQESRRLAPKVSPQAIEWLQSYEFYGNIREFNHRLQRACFRAEGREILAEDFC